jgi:hypothetical protein
MERFKNDLAVVEFSPITGTVMDSTKLAATHVSTKVDMITGPRVDSQIRTNQEIWIKTESGLEKNFQLTDELIPLRDGQTVTMVVGKNNIDNTDGLCMIVNHSSGEFHSVEAPSGMGGVVKHKFQYLKFALQWAALILVLKIVVPMFDATPFYERDRYWIIWSIVCSVPFFVYKYYEYWWAAGARYLKFQEHLKNLGEMLVRNGPPSSHSKPAA